MNAKQQSITLQQIQNSWDYQLVSIVIDYAEALSSMANMLDREKNDVELINLLKNYLFLYFTPYDKENDNKNLSNLINRVTYILDSIGLSKEETDEVNIKLGDYIKELTTLHVPKLNGLNDACSSVMNIKQIGRATYCITVEARILKI